VLERRRARELRSARDALVRHLVGHDFDHAIDQAVDQGIEEEEVDDEEEDSWNLGSAVVRVDLRSAHGARVVVRGRAL
jgi:hypothetical protein